jgi:hypothetical protein
MENPSGVHATWEPLRRLRQPFAMTLSKPLAASWGATSGQCPQIMEKVTPLSSLECPHYSCLTMQFQEHVKKRCLKPKNLTDQHFEISLHLPIITTL